MGLVADGLVQHTNLAKRWDILLLDMLSVQPVSLILWQVPVSCCVFNNLARHVKPGVQSGERLVKCRHLESNAESGMHDR